MKTYYEEYEKIKNKGVCISRYEWNNMPEKERQKLLSEKTVLIPAGGGYACAYYEIIGNAGNMTNQECAIIADGGNLCFGFRMEGKKIVVYTD